MEGYRVNETAGPLCKYYGIGELAFIDELRTRQSERAAAKMKAKAKARWRNISIFLLGMILVTSIIGYLKCICS